MLIGVEGIVEVFHVGATNWTAAAVGEKLNVGDQLRTGPRSRATVRLSTLGLLRVSELMSYEIEPPRALSGKPGLNIKSGSAYFFNREKPQEIQIRTPSVTGAIRGTEFNILVAPDGRTEVTMIDGEVELTNRFGSLSLRGGDAGVAEVGRAPVKTAVLNAVNAIQWNLYYPGVLDVSELDLSPAERERLADSLAAYRSGELLVALNKYPANHQPASVADHLYLGALLLSVGLVDQTLPQLSAASDANHQALAEALRQLVAAVKFEPWTESSAPKLATEFLAASYYQQSRGNLAAALASARKAVEKSPGFAFGWERVAELEFSFGRTGPALAALNKSLALAPRNPQAIALQGFLLAAQNRIGEALKQFDAAIAIDGSLGNAWLGRGLCRIRHGRTQAGCEDLAVAAALEPNRALLRSYLGKAFNQAGDERRARHELDLARKFDPNDPTSWLYSALLDQEQSRINEAIHDLEQSQALNDQRSVYRSRLLLDQDAAVRGANLADIYHDDGMTDVSVREAAKAVSEDYANSSAHLFLADSYDQLRDPTQFNLRYETVWFNELLLANLLAPIGGGRLAQNVTQQEYSKLYQADGFGLADSTVVRSDRSMSQLTSQSGTLGDTSYALDLDYEHNHGVRVNNGLDSLQWDTTIKQQVTPQDTALVLVQYQDYQSGDNFQYYNQNQARPNYHFDETQQPMVLGGWNHEWTPGINTLLLGGRLENEQHFSDQAAPQLTLFQDASGKTIGAASEPLNVDYHNKLEIYTAELNQLVKWEWLTLSAGGRYQTGNIDANSLFNNPPPGLASLYSSPVSAEASSDGFRRLTGYGYLTVEPVDRLWLTGGLAYDDLTYPANFRNPPLAAGDEHASQLGPKAALVWNPMSAVTVRGDYTKSLGGVSLDESYRLEPTELAGFPQAFRSLIPESVVGSVAAPEYQTYGLALDLKFPTGTYAGISAQRLETTVNRDVGVFTLDHGLPPFQTTATAEALNYRENSISVSVNQLLGKNFVLGVGYSYAQVRLDDNLPGIPVAVLASARQQLNSHLQTASSSVSFNHPSGFFARAELNFYAQGNSGYHPALPGDDFFQDNLFLGYRFYHRHAQITAGILDLADSDYHLNALTIHQEWPHQRTFTLQLDFIF